MTKSTKKRVAADQRVKATILTKDPANSMTPVWTFGRIDADGKFAFDPKREDFDSDLFVEKLISYSSMTWREILRQMQTLNIFKLMNLLFLLTIVTF